MWGGTGANIYKYMAASDSTSDAPDLIGNFDMAKDIIDLSAIAVSVNGKGPQSFTFIGAADFTSVGGQVRVVQDASHNNTLIEATLAGHSTPDLEIRVGGLQNLTAASFALTAAQSTTDLANGASLTTTRTAATGGNNEYAYTNVVGQAFTSFEEFYSNSSALVTEALNYSDGNEAVSLLGPNLTYTDSSAGETLQFGGASFSLGAHNSKNIELSGASNATVVLHSGFGNASVSDLLANSGNAIQLDKSMFAYMNASMSQTQDLVALLNNATATAAGLQISDAIGDTLVLNGVTASKILASPNLISFA